MALIWLARICRSVAMGIAALNPAPRHRGRAERELTVTVEAVVVGVMLRSGAT